MELNGKRVLSLDDFTYCAENIGTYVKQEVVDEAMNCLPPACMTSSCAQMGEPYSHRLDAKTGHWRPTYATFKRVTSGPEGIWEFCGYCFHRQTVEPVGRAIPTI